MKKLMICTLAMLFATAAFANTEEQKEKYLKKDSSYKTTYVRFGTMGLPIEKDYIMAPSINAGWLYRENKTGVDVSVAFASVDKENKKGKENKEGYSYSFPKVQYLTFLSDDKQSPNYGTYFGIGGSVYSMGVEKWVDKNPEDDFNDEYLEYSSRYTGLAANASVGYSYKLGKKLLSSIQLSANMPTPLAINSKGDVYKPSFELNLGLGF